MNCLIIGANSDIAIALAHELARTKMVDEFYLVGRNPENLSRLADDLSVRYEVKVMSSSLDLQKLDFTGIANFYKNLEFRADYVVYAVGYLGEENSSLNNFADISNIINLNYADAVGLLELVAKDFELRKSGCIVGISSVAGMRGRQSNYLYGSAKAGFTAYLSGLRNRLFHSNCQVLTVLPGFVDTKMTKNMQLPKLLTVSPTLMAKRIVNGIRKKSNSVYSGLSWMLIMLIIRAIPEGIFKRLKL